MKKHNHALIKALFFIIITMICFPLHAEQQMIEGDNFVGIWQYHNDQYPDTTMHYLKITKVGKDKYKLIEGVKEKNSPISPDIIWNDKKSWAEFPDIYLILSNGKLKGQFISGVFRATHGIDFKWKITLEIKSDDKMVYSVRGEKKGETLTPETFEATRIKSSSASNKEYAQDLDEPPPIGVLKNSVIDDCGCSFHRASQNKNTDAGQYIFVVGYSGQARININGQDIELRENGRKINESGRCARNSCTYSGSGITATARYRQTSKCPPEPTECEVNDYDVTITVEKGGHRQIVRGKGQCGC